MKVANQYYLWKKGATNWGGGGGEGRGGAEGKRRGEESLHSFYSREVHPQNAYVTG